MSVEHTGGSSSYYSVVIENPTTEGRPQYYAECNDIIEALDMTYAEANVFKACWRKAAERTLGLKKAGNNAVYDSEKMVFFSERTLVQEKAKVTATKKVSYVFAANSTEIRDSEGNVVLSNEPYQKLTEVELKNNTEISLEGKSLIYWAVKPTLSLEEERILESPENSDFQDKVISLRDQLFREGAFTDV